MYICICIYVYMYMITDTNMRSDVSILSHPRGPRIFGRLRENYV